MSEGTAGLRRKIDSATELHAVVRTMKALAASNIGQYENAVRALADYYRTVELGLAACLRRNGSIKAARPAAASSAVATGAVTAIVFGSDQGLVGRFNEVVTEHAVRSLADLPGPPRVWAIGERVHALLTDAGLPPVGLHTVPASVHAITALVGKVLVDSQAHAGYEVGDQLHLFYNRPEGAASYTTIVERLLPLDEAWRQARARQPWPTKQAPEIIGGDAATLAALVGEYIFVSLFRACAQSLASENASRLAAMQRADKNIEELLEDLRAGYHRLRQSGIDEELFDLIAGFEALNRQRPGGR